MSNQISNNDARPSSKGSQQAKVKKESRFRRLFRRPSDKHSDKKQVGPVEPNATPRNEKEHDEVKIAEPHNTPESDTQRDEVDPLAYHDTAENETELDAVDSVEHHDTAEIGTEHGEGANEHLLDPEELQHHLHELHPYYVLKMPLVWVLRHFRHFSVETQGTLRAYGRYYASLPVRDEDFVPADRQPTPPVKTDSTPEAAERPAADMAAAEKFNGPDFKPRHDPDELFFFVDNPEYFRTQQQLDAQVALEMSTALQGTEFVGPDYRIKYD
ncbi:hypothetical protein F5Y05DRAFT_417943 [Hypoxylon sp. FL0543]|nr:hypothetical protein F5Y05DRAFT_417943 [Hypoxylon sp. FL0543]